MDITEEVKEVADRAFELLEMKSPHQLAVELVELQRKHNIALSALDKMQDQRDQLVAQLNDYSQRGAVAPDGWQIVPRLPTNEMLAAFRKADSDWEDGYAFDDNGNRHESPVYQWVAMLDAAPKPEEAQ